MGKRDDLIAKYAEELQQKCGVTPDMDLLAKVTIGCGPAIFNEATSTLSATQPEDVMALKNNFLIKKLGLSDGPELRDAIEAVLETYKAPEGQAYRAVVHYLLTRHFGRETQFL